MSGDGRAGLRSKRDVYVVAVRAHPRVSCAVRGVENAGLSDVRTRTWPLRMCRSSTRTEHCERAEARWCQWGNDAEWVK